MPPEILASSAGPQAGIESAYLQLEARVRAARPHDDYPLLRRAFEYSRHLHSEQRRQSGEAYIEHPLAVASVLAEMRMDVPCIAAGLLHDAVEDTPATTEEIGREFGATVAHLVESVTKIDRLDLQRADDRQAENFRKMLLAMVDDIRVILIKLADRLHNMRTLEHLPVERRRRIALETMEIYAPLAHRLGMGRMRGELEDLAFATLEPSAHAQIQAAVESRRAGGEEFLATVQERMRSALSEHDIPARLEGRIKRNFSIWQKLQRQRIDVDQVYDLLAVRIITDSVKNCYAALGVIHSSWRPVPGRIKDFIATPRPNMYRSLHTSVIDASGQPFEIQIRTEDMHRMAEEGIAAHWKYKDGTQAPEAEDQRLIWLRRLVESQRETADPTEFLATLKSDLAPEDIYAFTPKGQIITLGREACPVDFAYAIHTQVGERCIGAKVNGRMVPLRHRLETGDIVEIATQPNHTPNRDWLSFVRSSKARQKIRHWLNTNERSRATEIGRVALEREARRLGFPVKDINEAVLDFAGKQMKIGKSEEVLAGLGFGKFSARQVMAYILPVDQRTPEQSERLQPSSRPPRTRTAGGPILVRGYDDLLVYRAACCNPIHGEPIIGYITRGRGVAVHSDRCSNVQRLLYDSDRRMDVEWAPTSKEVTAVKLLIYSDDNAGMLNAITSVISGQGNNIRNIGTKTSDGQAQIDLVVDVADSKSLEAIVLGLKRIPGVHQIERVTRG